MNICFVPSVFYRENGGFFFHNCEFSTFSIFFKDVFKKCLLLPSALFSVHIHSAFSRLHEKHIISFCESMHRHFIQSISVNLSVFCK